MTDDDWKLPEELKGTPYDREAFPLMPLDDHDVPIQRPTLEHLWGKKIEKITKTGAKGHVHSLHFYFDDGHQFIMYMDAVKIHTGLDVPDI
jgi:hypothetical protein